MIDMGSEVPRWRQAYDLLVKRIESGEYPQGSRVPSVVSLAGELGIAQATAHKALIELKAKGYTHTVPGLGSYVGPGK